MNILNLNSNLNLLKIHAMNTHYFHIFMFIVYFTTYDLHTIASIMKRIRSDISLGFLTTVRYYLVSRKLCFHHRLLIICLIHGRLYNTKLSWFTIFAIYTSLIPEVVVNYGTGAGKRTKGLSLYNKSCKLITKYINSNQRWRLKAVYQTLW